MNKIIENHFTLLWILIRQFIYRIIFWHFFLIRKTFGLLLRMMKHTLMCSHVLFGKDMVTGEVQGYVTRLLGGFAG